MVGMIIVIKDADAVAVTLLQVSQDPTSGLVPWESYVSVAVVVE